MSLKRAVDTLIYLSVVLGVFLLPNLFGAVPTWLFFSVMGGWLAYLVVAILVAMGRFLAYPAALVLAVLTLAVSLPQPEHYSILQAGPSLASATFLIGSLLQIALILLIPLYLHRTRRKVPNSKALRRRTESRLSKPARLLQPVYSS